MNTLIISGGSSGIGRATADLFAQRGYQVYDLSRHGTDRDGVIHLNCDVTDEANVQSAVSTVLAQSGRIDVLISNAGYGISGPIEFTETIHAQRLMDVNLFGALNLTKAVLPTMRAQHSGRIFYTSSVAGPLPIPYQAFYSASKAALDAMALSLQNEVRQFGIKVACLLPGDVRTDFTANREKEQSGDAIYTISAGAVKAMERDEIHGMKPEQIAHIYWRMANSHCLHTFYIGGGLYKLYYLLHKLLPVGFVNWIEGKLYH